LKKTIQCGITKIEDIILKNKQHQSIHQQKNNDRDITGKTAEELPELFFTN
jgi:hypothetical protein